MFNELERVALTVDLPAYNLRTGDMGIVVDVTSDGEEFTIEFLTLDGETFAVVPVTLSQIRRVGRFDITNARPISA